MTPRMFSIDHKTCSAHVRWTTKHDLWTTEHVIPAIKHAVWSRKDVLRSIEHVLWSSEHDQWSSGSILCACSIPNDLRSVKMVYGQYNMFHRKIASFSFAVSRFDSPDRPSARKAKDLCLSNDRWTARASERSIDRAGERSID